jgi:hypothetical protein
VARNSTIKVYKWDDQSSNYGPLHICNVQPIELSSQDIDYKEHWLQSKLLILQLKMHMKQLWSYDYEDIILIV